MYKVVINLKNNNALVALAYIKTNDNPVAVFCNYILFVLKKSAKQSMRIDELHDSIFEKFGLDLPIQMINICINILKKRKSVEMLPNGAGVCCRDTDFDISSFEQLFSQLHSKEETVLNCLINYVKEKWGVEWSSTESKQYLSDFLDKEGNGASIFLDDEICKANKLSPSWYIGHFISELQKNHRDCVEWQYLLDVINGIMIYQGVYYIGNYNQNKAQKFKDAEFYIDTKLLLRYLGYSFPAQVKAAQELINLIIDEYQGKVSVFDQTIFEVTKALTTAGDEYNKGKEISDWELRGYALLNPTGAELLSENAEALPRTIEKARINRCTVSDWGRSEYHNDYIDETDLITFIKSEHPSWRDGAIKNDVAVINQINILRKSDYSVKYGGKNKRPVFVTTNLALVYSVKDYTIKAKKDDANSKWNSHALPVISDNMLLFRLWVPVANKYSDLPAITMSKYAYAAQNAEMDYFALLKEKALSYKNEKNIDTISISEARRSKLEEIIVKNTNGDLDRLTDEVYALSVDELLSLEKNNLLDDLRKKDIMLSQKDSIIVDKSKEIVEALAQPHINKLGISRFLIPVAKFWWIVSAVVLYSLAYLLDCFVINSNTRILNWLLFAVPLAIKIIEKVLDHCGSSPKFSNWLITHAVHYTSRKYARKVLTSRVIAKKDKEVQRAVLIECFEKTKVFVKYKAFVPPIDGLLDL